MHLLCLFTFFFFVLARSRPLLSALGVACSSLDVVSIRQRFLSALGNKSTRTEEMGSGRGCGTISLGLRVYQ